MEERLKAAKSRVDEIVDKIKNACADAQLSLRGKDGEVVNAFYRDAEFVSTFDVNPIGSNHTEAEAMGNCIGLLLQCDAMVIDKGVKVYSKGMDAEHHVCNIYGKAIIYYWPETITNYIK